MLAMVIDSAASTSALDLVRAEDACHDLNLRLVELFHDVRLLITPTVAAEPPLRSLGGSGMINGSAEYNWVKFTYPFNMTRSPAASIPVGLTASGLPVGLQLVGPQHADLVVLRSLGRTGGRHRVRRRGAVSGRSSRLSPFGPELAGGGPGYDVRLIRRGPSGVDWARAFSSVG